jgi:hypothetical protein
MKLFTTILFILLYSNSYCQKKTHSLSSDIRSKIKNIDAYIKGIDLDPKLFHRIVFVPEYSIYSTTSYVTNGQPPIKTLKEVIVTQNVKTTYYKDDRIVYVNEISSAHGNYSNIKAVYFQNDKIIYATKKLYKEQILKIQQSYNGAEQGGSYNLIITRDSIIYSGDRKKVAVTNSLPSWNKLKGSFSLADLDKVQSTGFRSYIDGHDLSYIITTDKRTHSFVNAQGDTQLKKMAEFFKQLYLLTPQ